MAVRDEQVTEDLIKEDIRIARDNNRLLRKLWRAQVFNFWSRLVFIAVLIGVPVFVYRVYLSDYVVHFKDAYYQLRENISTFVESDTTSPGIE